MNRLIALLDNLDDVPDFLHEYYTEKDGKYILNLEQNSVREHPHVLALKNAHDRTTQELREARGRLSEAQQRTEGLPEDFDPAEYTRLVAEDRARKDNPDKPDQQLASQRDMYEDRIRQAGVKHADDLRKAEERRVSLQRQLDGRDKDAELDAALATVGIKKEFLPAVRALLRPQVQLERHEGEDRPEVYLDTDMGRQSVGQYVGNWVQTDAGKIYVSPATGGDAGGSGDRSGRGVDNPWRSDNGQKPNLTRQQEIISANPSLAKRLASQAGVTLNI